MTKKIVIDSFEKAVQKLGENHPCVLQWRMFEQSNIGSAMPDVEAYVKLPTGEMAEYVDAIEVTKDGKANQFERFVFPDPIVASNFGFYFQRLLAQFLIG